MNLDDRLARRARQRRADGRRGLRARWALRRLGRRSRRAWRKDPYGRIVSGHDLREVVWRLWLANPDELAWRLLRPFQRDRALRTAVEPSRTPAERAAIGAFCTARGLVPQHPADRALFFVLTGQHGQHRAADPDGTLLAAAYRGAYQETRAAVRKALAGSGDLDLIAVLAGAGRQRLAEVTADEADYLASQLAGRRDWAGLWRLVLDLPLVTVPGAMARFGDGWRPPDERGRALFECLARPAPGLAVACRALVATWRIESPGPVWDCSFSPGQWLTVLSRDDRGSLCRVFELPGGALAWQRPGVEVKWVGDGGAEHASPDPVPRPELSLHPAALAAIQGIANRTGRGVRCSDHGNAMASLTLLDTLELPDIDGRPVLLAADPATGRLAVAGGGMTWITGRAAGRVSVLGRIPGQATGACFPGPDHVITTSETGAHRYHLTGGEPRLEASSPVELPARCPVAIRAREEIALLRQDPVSGWRVAYLDVRALSRTRFPREFTGQYAHGLWGSPDGRYHAISDGNRVEVTASLPGYGLVPLADRPLGSLLPADARVVAAATRDMVPGSVARPLADALAAGLEYLFGAEIALGRGVRGRGVAAGPDEIALAPGTERPS